jgi:hypothetical protein
MISKFQICLARIRCNFIWSAHAIDCVAFSRVTKGHAMKLRRRDGGENMRRFSLAIVMLVSDLIGSALPPGISLGTPGAQRAGVA